MEYFIHVKFKEFKMILKSKEFQIVNMHYIMQMLNYLLLIFQIL